MSSKGGKKILMISFIGFCFTLCLFFAKNIFTTSFSYSEVSFTSSTISTVNDPFNIQVADMDYDGDDDFVVSSVGDDAIYLFTNDGSGNFTSSTLPVASPVMSNPHRLLLQDINGDNYPEIFVADSAGHKVFYYKNNSGSSYTFISVRVAMYNAESVALGDFDGDSDDDLAIARYDTTGPYTSLELVTNAEGANPLQNASSVTLDETSGRGYRVVVTDIDDDSDIDIFMSSWDAKLIWYENNGTANTSSMLANFTASTTLSTDGQITDLGVVDMDGDTDEDIIFSSNIGQYVKMLKNDGSENFTESTINTTDINFLDIELSDFDEDGDTDIIALGSGSSIIFWYENDGSANFTERTIVSSEQDYKNLAVIDADDDGFNDIVSIDNSSGSYAVTFHRTVPTPSEPTSLNFTTSTSSSISLAWTDNSSIETDYYVAYSVEDADAFTTSTLSANTTSTVISDLSANTTYHFKIYCGVNTDYSSYLEGYFSTDGHGIIYSNDDDFLTYAGTWETVTSTDSRMLNGWETTTYSTSTASSTISSSFYGSWVAGIFGIMYENGIVEYSIDGGSWATTTTFGEGSKNTSYFTVNPVNYKEVLLGSGLSFATHTISVRLTNDHDSRHYENSEPYVDTETRFAGLRYGHDSSVGSVEIKLENIYRVDILGADVTLSQDGQTIRTTKTGDNGRASIAGLPVGDYVIEYTHDDYETTTSSISIVEDTVTSIDRDLVMSSGHDRYGQVYYPSPGVPVLVEQGSSITIEVDGGSELSNWSGYISSGGVNTSLTLSAEYMSSSTWNITTEIPSTVSADLYDLTVVNSVTTSVKYKSVKVLSEFKTDFWFAFIESLEEKWGDYWMANGYYTDYVIEDLNSFGLEFVIAGGDNIANPYSTSAARTKFGELVTEFREFDDPVFAIAGNHDIGGSADERVMDVWQEIIGKDSFGLTYNNTHFSFLNDGLYQMFSIDDFGTEEIAWVQNDIYQNQDKDLSVFVRGMVNIGIAPVWRPDWENLNSSDYYVDAVLFGHYDQNQDYTFHHTNYVQTADIKDGDYRLIHVASDGTYETFALDYEDSIGLPTNLSLTGSSNSSLTVSWADNTSVEDSYSIGYAVAGSDSFTYTALAENATSATISGLSAGTQYTIKVRWLKGDSYSYGTTANFSTQNTAGSIYVFSTKKIDKVEVKTPDTCPLTEGQPYKHKYSAAVYYITEDCTKKAFKRSKVYFTYFDSWNEVITTTKTKLDSIPNDNITFMPWGHKYDPKYGALVKIISDPKVYLLLNTEKYWITSEDVFTALNYAWNWIEDISTDLLDKYETGSEITDTSHHPNYTLIKYENSNKVYRLEPGSTEVAPGRPVKRWIPNEEVFNSLNFRWDRIVTVEDSEDYVDGEDLTTY